MNDMDEQLRQLEGAYTDSEEDYAEEEEQYDELMDEVHIINHGAGRYHFSAGRR